MDALANGELDANSRDIDGDVDAFDIVAATGGPRETHGRLIKFRGGRSQRQLPVPEIEA